jgi:4-hydroxy-tetrahydrodipicolinate synthase
MFSGSIVALVTPFKNGKVDVENLKKLVEFHIKEGTNGIVPCGTTGESPTLSFEEHEMVIDVVVQAARGRVPVIAGTGSNSTQEAIMLTKYAKKSGVDGVLLVSPYYNKPTQEGLFLHFKAIAEEVDIPIVLYNIASRTAVNIEPETIARLSAVKTIVAVKEASGNLDQMAKIVSLCGERMKLLSGDDALTLPLLAIGGVGVISVVANIVPRKVATMVRNFLDNDIRAARALHYELYALVKAMFIETNPIPVKTAMGLMKMINPELRLPLSDMREDNVKKLRKVLLDYALIQQ